MRTRAVIEKSSLRPEPWEPWDLESWQKKIAPAVCLRHCPPNPEKCLSKIKPRVSGCSKPALLHTGKFTSHGLIWKTLVLLLRDFLSALYKITAAWKKKTRSPILLVVPIFTSNLLRIPKPKNATPTLRDPFADLQYVLEKYVILILKKSY